MENRKDLLEEVDVSVKSDGPFRIFGTIYLDPDLIEQRTYFFEEILDQYLARVKETIKRKRILILKDLNDE
jgi:hypothetical protein